MNEYDYLAKASKKMEDEKYHEVIKLCDKALKINEKLPDAYDFRGNAKYELGKYNEAIDDFSKAVELEPDESEHYYDRSWAYRGINNYVEAILDINKALSIKPASLYYYDKGRFEYDMERYKEAIEDFTKGIELRPTESKYRFRANCYSELGIYDLALADYNSAIELEPESYYTYYRRGLLKSKMECLEDALKDFKKVLELNSEHDDAMTEIGFIKIELGKKDAIKYFNKAIKVNPCAYNYFFRVLARRKILKRQYVLEKLSTGEVPDFNYDKDETFNEKQAKDDIKDLNKALALNTSESMYIDLLETRLERYNYLKDYSGIVNDSSELIELENNNKYFLMRGIAQYHLGNYKKAEEDCNKFIEITKTGNCAKAFYIKGMIEYKCYKYKNAVENFSKAILCDNKNEFYYYRGLTNYKLKHYKNAYEDIAKVIKSKSCANFDYEEKIPFLIKIFIRFSKSTKSPIGLCYINRKSSAQKEMLMQ